MAVLSAIGAIASGAAAAVGATAGAIASGVGAAAGAVGSAVGAAAGAVGSVASGVGSAVGAGAGALAKGAGAVAKGVGSAVGAGADVAGSILGAGADAVGGLASGVGEVVSAVGGEAVDVAGNILGAGGEVLGNVADIATDVVTSGADVVGDVISGGADVVGDVIGGGVDVVGDVLGAGADVVGDVVGGGVDVVGDVLGAGADFVEDVVTGGGGLVDDRGIGEVIGDVVEFTGGKIGTIADMAGNVVNAAGEFIGNIKDGNLLEAYQNYEQISGIVDAASAIGTGIAGAQAVGDVGDFAEQSENFSNQAINTIRDPGQIISEAYGPGGLYSQENLDTIFDAEGRILPQGIDLLKDYATGVIQGEGGLLDVQQQITENTLSRIQELGPEFREALQDPQIAQLVNDQINRFNESIASTEARSEERLAAAAEFDQGLTSALESAGLSMEALRTASTDSATPFLDTIADVDASGILDFDLSALTDFDTSGLRGFDLSGVTDQDFSGLQGIDTEGVRGVDISPVSDFDTSGLRDFDLSGVTDLDFQNLQDLTFDELGVDTSVSDEFLQDIRDLDPITFAAIQEDPRLAELAQMEIDEAKRLSAEAMGPLSFEAIRNAEQAALQQGLALGRTTDASAIARAALSREDQVQARQDRATASRLRALGAVGASAEEARARRGLSAQEIIASFQSAINRAKLGAETGLSQEQLDALQRRTKAQLDLTKESKLADLGLSQAEIAARLGLTAEEAATRLDLTAAEAAAKLGISQEEIATRLGLDKESKLSTLGLSQAEIAAKLGLNAETVASQLDLTAAEAAAKLGISKEEIAQKLNLEKGRIGGALGLAVDELGISQADKAGRFALDNARLNALLGTQAREESRAERAEGREDFRTTFDAASAGSVDPSQIFFGESAPARNVATNIFGMTPGPIVTDPGQAVNVGMATDANLANILSGKSAISAVQSAGAADRANTNILGLANILGEMDFGTEPSSSGSAFNPAPVNTTNIFGGTTTPSSGGAFGQDYVDSLLTNPLDDFEYAEGSLSDFLNNP